jgi:hypothetical protein
MVTRLLAYRTDTSSRRTGPYAAVLLSMVVAPVALWHTFQLVSLGPTGYMEHLRQQQAASAVSALAPVFSGAVTSIEYMQSSTASLLGLGGLFYVWPRIIRRRESAERLLLPLFATFWLVWFVALSVGYARYAIPLIATCCLFQALLFHDVVSALGSWRRWAMVTVFAVVVLFGIGLQLRALAQEPDTAARQMGALITQQVEPQASIESLEWELDVLTERPFHHPPPFVPLIPYAVPSSTAYLVDGPASKSTELYVGHLADNAYDRVATIGPYDLYRRQ